MFFALVVLSLTPISGRRMYARRTNLHSLRSLPHFSEDFIPTLDFYFFAFEFGSVYILYVLFVAIIVEIVDSKLFLSLILIASCNIFFAPLTAIGFEHSPQKRILLLPFQLKNVPMQAEISREQKFAHVVRE